ncbi:MAG: hypothetical protein IRY90_10220 [Actinomadura rubrobrunea]|nr:hypothetical protein [Actinomadura rubrobrunea]
MDEELFARGRRLVQVIRAMVTEYPAADPDVTPTVRLTVERQGLELDHVELSVADLQAFTDLIERQRATWRNAHPDQSGQCAHCAGTGSARLGDGDGAEER